MKLALDNSTMPNVNCFDTDDRTKGTFEEEIKKAEQEVEERKHQRNKVTTKKGRSVRFDTPMDDTTIGAGKPPHSPQLDSINYLLEESKGLGLGESINSSQDMYDGGEGEDSSEEEKDESSLDKTPDQLMKEVDDIMKDGQDDIEEDKEDVFGDKADVLKKDEGNESQEEEKSPNAKDDRHTNDNNSVDQKKEINKDEEESQKLAESAKEEEALSERFKKLPEELQQKALNTTVDRVIEKHPEFFKWNYHGYTPAAAGPNSAKQDYEAGKIGNERLAINGYEIPETEKPNYNDFTYSEADYITFNQETSF